MARYRWTDPGKSKDRNYLALHAPAADGEPFEGLKHQVFDGLPDAEDGDHASEDLVGEKFVAALEDIPAQSALLQGAA